MEQESAFTYRVRNGEVVTIRFTPVTVGPFAELAVDGVSLQNIGGSTPTFRLPVTKSAGAHRGHARCDFPEGTPNGAEYRTTLSGSLGGGSFPGPTIPATDPTGEFDLNFQVVS